MSRTFYIYVGILILLFAGAFAIEFSKPRPINWAKTFNETHTIPYGTFIFYNEFESLFPNSTVEDIGVTPYEFFDEYYNWEEEDYTTSGNYIYIDEQQTIDEVSAQELLDFASYGNTIFISSSYLPDMIMDSLGIETEYEYNFTGKAELSLANPVFKKDSITIEKGLNNIYFSTLDSLNTTVLGYQNFNIDDQINFVKIDYEGGEFLIHLQPIVFTNYYLLKKDNAKYAEAIMSYVPDDTIFFDSRAKKRNDLSSSPLRFILSNPELKWAWYFGLLALLVFMVFNAKRKQRVVKIVKPHTNTTVAFTKTIGNLYYETKDHNNVIEKKITYFLEYLRRVYFLDTQLLDEKFMKNLALKSGRDSNEIKKLINLIVHLRAKQHCNENNLLDLNRAIESFHSNKE